MTSTESLILTFSLQLEMNLVPQPQTSEHLAAIEIMKLKHIIILQNKIDLVKETQAQDQHEQILAFVQGENRPNILTIKAEE